MRSSGGPLLAGYRFEECIEVFQAGVFNDHPAAAVLVFDRDLETQGSLQRVPGFAHIGIQGSLRFFFTWPA